MSSLYQRAILPDAAATDDKPHDGVPTTSTITASTLQQNPLVAHSGPLFCCCLDHPRAIDKRTSLHARFCPAPTLAARQRETQIQIESACAIRRARTPTTARPRAQTPSPSERGPPTTTTTAAAGRRRRRAHGSARGRRERSMAPPGRRSSVKPRARFFLTQPCVSDYCRSSLGGSYSCRCTGCGLGTCRSCSGCPLPLRRV